MDVDAVELRKADEFCNVPYNCWIGPRLEKLMLCLGWPIAIGGDIVANKFETLWKDEALLEAQGKTVCLAYPQLTFHVKE